MMSFQQKILHVSLVFLMRAVSSVLF